MAIGLTQLFVILVIIFVLFGAGRLPQVMSDLGKGLRSFRDAANKMDQNLDKE